MLKGQRVLTQSYFGTVLNDAEREQCVIMDMIREKVVVPERHGSIWYKPSYSYWRVVSYRVAVPWSEVGAFTFWNCLPKFLHKRVLERRKRR